VPTFPITFNLESGWQARLDNDWFEYEEVRLSGSWMGWPHWDNALPMTQKNDGSWTLTTQVPVGNHQYKILRRPSQHDWSSNMGVFAARGRWAITPVHGLIDDDFGGFNAQLIVNSDGSIPAQMELETAPLRATLTYSVWTST